MNVDNIRIRNIHQKSVSEIDIHSPGVSLLIPKNNVYPRYTL